MVRAAPVSETVTTRLISLVKARVVRDMLAPPYAACSLGPTLRVKTESATSAFRPRVVRERTTSHTPATAGGVTRSHGPAPSRIHDVKEVGRPTSSIGCGRGHDDGLDIVETDEAETFEKARLLAPRTGGRHDTYSHPAWESHRVLGVSPSPVAVPSSGQAPPALLMGSRFGTQA